MELLDILVQNLYHQQQYLHIKADHTVVQQVELPQISGAHLGLIGELDDQDDAQVEELKQIQSIQALG